MFWVPSAKSVDLITLSEIKAKYFMKQVPKNLKRRPKKNQKTSDIRPLISDLFFNNHKWLRSIQI